jgi:hypothetical protein
VAIVGVALLADDESGYAVLRYAARGVSYENPPAGWNTARMELNMSHEHDEYSGTGVLAK